jgi:hypothetical protein
VERWSRYVMDFGWDDSSSDARVLQLCCDYGWLREQPLEELTSEEQQQRRTLEELLLGDPQRHRRAHRRISTMIPVSVRSVDGGDAQHGVLLNVSAGGMYLALTEPLPTGTHVDVELARSNGDRFVFSAIVQREEHASGRPCVGLALTRSPVFQQAYHVGDSTA